MLRRWDDSQKYLSDHPHLVCEETANSLVAACIDFEVDEVSPARRRCVRPPVGSDDSREIKLCEPFLLETCPDGAGGAPGHRDAVYLGFGSDGEGRPQRLLQEVLLKHQGVFLGSPAPCQGTDTVYNWK